MPPTIHSDFINYCSQSCHPLSTLTNGAPPPIILFILCLFSRQPAALSFLFFFRGNVDRVLHSFGTVIVLGGRSSVQKKKQRKF